MRIFRLVGMGYYDRKEYQRERVRFEMLHSGVIPIGEIVTVRGEPDARGIIPVVTDKGRELSLFLWWEGRAFRLVE